ncbi:histidine phosphatase family protein [Lysinibacillus cavernae]|uniref:histidine phosphatase family protein n=1 Tax=Lysinibacillus cavernae TaxID=2666135 RepID=UPI0012D8DD97|nr:histidine phosphatase family protein [Lysinibacillus cavernae]
MTVIYFVRHAHAHYSVDEYHRPLSVQGMKDAERVTYLFKEQQIDAVYASPYRRAIQTVEGIAQTRHLPIQTVDALKERQLSSGAMEDFQAAVQQVWRDPSFAWEGGESNQQAMARAVQSLQAIMLAHPQETIVIGTHGNIMVLMMHYFDPQYGYAFWQKLTMPDVYRLTFQGLSLREVKHVWQEDRA